MARPLKDSEPWHQKAAELMVRHEMSLRAAAQELGYSLDAQEAENLFRRKGFQKVLWIERNRYYQELGSDPQRSKESAIGLMWLAIQKMATEGNWDRVVEGVLKLAKVEGWVGADNNVNVFATMTASEIEAVKKRLQDMANVRERAN